MSSLLGLPLGIVLTFKVDTGIAQLESLWLGLVVGLFAASGISVLFLVHWDWNKIVQMSQEDNTRSYVALRNELDPI